MSEVKTDDQEYKGKVNLVSSEGDKFEVETRTAAMSELVKTMLIDGDDDDEDEDEDENEQEIPLPNVKSAVLAKVVEFCNYHVTNGPMKEIEKPLKYLYNSCVLERGRKTVSILAEITEFLTIYKIHGIPQKSWNSRQFQ